MVHTIKILFKIRILRKCFHLAKISLLSWSKHSSEPHMQSPFVNNMKKIISTNFKHNSINSVRLHICRSGMNTFMYVVSIHVHKD